MKQLIIEGRYDSLVTKLSNKLLEVIKNSYSAVSDPKGKFGKQKTYFRKGEKLTYIETEKYRPTYWEEVNAPDIPLEFYLSLKVQWQEGLGTVISDGGAYNDSKKVTNAVDPPLIEVLFELDPEQYPNVLSRVAMELRDILRHEIEHLTQSGWNINMAKYLRGDEARRNKINTRELPAYKYYLLPKEIPAMIQGLYMRAKKSKQPFKDVVNANLQRGVDNGMISADEKETIIKTWRKYLPKLGIQQEL